MKKTYLRWIKRFRTHRNTRSTVRVPDRISRYVDLS